MRTVAHGIGHDKVDDREHHEDQVEDVPTPALAGEEEGAALGAHPQQQLHKEEGAADVPGHLYGDVLLVMLSQPLDAHAYEHGVEDDHEGAHGVEHGPLHQPLQPGLADLRLARRQGAGLPLRDAVLALVRAPERLLRQGAGLVRAQHLPEAAPGLAPGWACSAVLRMHHHGDRRERAVPEAVLAAHVALGGRRAARGLRLLAGEAAAEHLRLPELHTEADVLLLQLVDLLLVRKRDARQETLEAVLLSPLGVVGRRLGSSHGSPGGARGSRAAPRRRAGKPIGRSRGPAPAP
mmetsp:Transcript_85495/g.266056  ORF Transcript_85495/g.266056 Transcript_85495/m.266056 type:complete len:293 (-) Transcript_85495:3-881(-)